MEQVLRAYTQQHTHILYSCIDWNMLYDECFPMIATACSVCSVSCDLPPIFCAWISALPNISNTICLFHEAVWTNFRAFSSGSCIESYDLIIPDLLCKRIHLVGRDVARWSFVLGGGGLSINVVCVRICCFSFALHGQRLICYNIRLSEDVIIFQLDILHAHTCAAHMEDCDLSNIGWLHQICVLHSVAVIDRIRCAGPRWQWHFAWEFRNFKHRFYPNADAAALFRTIFGNVNDDWVTTALWKYKQTYTHKCRSQIQMSQRWMWRLYLSCPNCIPPWWMERCEEQRVTFAVIFSFT